MGSETSLRFQIKELEKIIAIQEKKGEDTKFERRLLKSWRKYAEGRNHHKLLQDAPESKSGGLRG